MMNLKPFRYLLLALIVTVSCKEPFNPALTPTQTNYLVVEGIINARGVTTIKLSRTTPLNAAATNEPELHAQVKIVGEDNSNYTVIETQNGTYVSGFNTLPANQKYRLQIKTSSGGEYLSEFTGVKISPAIDSISYRNENNGVQVSVSTHDQQNNSRYYLWDYEETWELHSAFTNNYQYKNGVVSHRNQADIPGFYYCWSTEKSTNILTGSTAQLKEDVVSLAPITFIPIESPKLGVRYSILIRQSAIDEKAYSFFRMMKSNTESLGTIFSPLPSDLTGNITSVNNPAEKVIGYITSASIVEKRIFISSQDVGARYHLYCESKEVPNNVDSFKFYFSQGLLPYEADATPPAPITKYYSASASCIDCTLRGSNIKPSFW